MALHSILSLSDILINVGMEHGKMNPENECVHQCEQEIQSWEKYKFCKLTFHAQKWFHAYDSHLPIYFIYLFFTKSLLSN